jgi:hypothetical protein
VRGLQRGVPRRGELAMLQRIGWFFIVLSWFWPLTLSAAVLGFIVYEIVLLYPYAGPLTLW